jgi:hypothetical protein
MATGKHIATAESYFIQTAAVWERYFKERKSTGGGLAKRDKELAALRHQFKDYLNFTGEFEKEEEPLK